MTTLASLNALDDAAFVAALNGIYEHSPWIAKRAASRRPFSTLAALKLALQDVVNEASEGECLMPEWKPTSTRSAMSSAATRRTIRMRRS
jgi:2-oxo-4-hydroxy-4-carboxy--5-ureidoimidazoline (OHCU) decarboxylase